MISKTTLMLKKQWLEDIQSNFFLQEFGKGWLCHYTSLQVLFSILENDSVWVSSTRFSNDSSEENFIKNDDFKNIDYMSDSFIVCFSNKSDCLSQWRGYCPNGGAAIEFDIRQPRIYSILHADFDKSHRYELEFNAPLSVLYVPHNFLTDSSDLSAQMLTDVKKKSYYPWEIGDIVPFFKDDAFSEESEWRLMFGNRDGQLSKCVRFRTQHDGVKVPYMVVKSGDMGKNYSRCVFESKEYEPDRLSELIDKRTPFIRIPQGSDQESVYYKVEKTVNEYNKNKGLKSDNRIKIYCEGHLPIRRIIVAPTYDRERIAEKIKRYCWSNYWLRDVDVTFSNIPYIPPSE